MNDRLVGQYVKMLVLQGRMALIQREVDVAVWSIPNAQLAAFIKEQDRLDGAYWLWEASMKANMRADNTERVYLAKALTQAAEKVEA